MQTYAVIDFETTGLSPAYDRIIEVGVVLVENDTVVDTFNELMNPGFPIPFYITALTGITSEMVKGMPSPEEVMSDLEALIGSLPCVAHNASFDRGFFAAEMSRANIYCEPPFLCSMLLARRLVQNVDSHKLGNLVRHLRLRKPAGMKAHRALADSLMTVELWKHLMKRIKKELPGYTPDAEFIQRLTRTPKANVDSFFYSARARLRHNG